MAGTTPPAPAVVAAAEASSPRILDALVLIGVLELVVRFGPSAEHTWPVLFLFAAVVAVATAFERLRGYDGAGWDLLSGRAASLWGFLGLAIALGVWSITALARLGLGFTDPYLPWWAVTSIVTAPFGFVVLVVLAGPVVEEVVFRGFLYRSLRSRLGAVGSVVVSTVAFTVGHPAGSLLTAILLGIATALVYERFRSLWAPIAVHVACNGCLLLLGLATYHLGDVPGVGW